MKHKSYIFIAIAVIGLSIFFISGSSSQFHEKWYIVKMYSGGKVIATWTAHDLGRVDGETLILTIGGDFDAFTRQVRINGVYTVEEKE